MATTITSVLKFGAVTVETLDAAVVAAGLSNRKVTHNGYERTVNLNGTDTPAASFVSSQLLAAANSGTIDCTSLSTTEGTRSATGLKLVAMRIHNLAARASDHNFNIAVGASNGMAIGGSSIRVHPKGSILIFFDDALVDVSGSLKTLDWTYNVAATGGVEVTLIFG